MIYKTLAFLQNAWFKPGVPEQFIRRYIVDPNFHRKILSNSQSGKRLMRAFGDHYDNIIWTNTTPDCADCPSGRIWPNLKYMKEEIKKHHPIMILGFGRQAEDSITKLYNEDIALFNNRMTMFHKHPTARGVSQAGLNDFAEKVIRAITV